MLQFSPQKRLCRRFGIAGSPCNNLHAPIRKNLDGMGSNPSGDDHRNTHIRQKIRQKSRSMPRIVHRTLPGDALILHLINIKVCTVPKMACDLGSLTGNRNLHL